MRRILTWSLLGVTLTGCAAAREPSTAAPPPRAEPPVYAVGDRWIRSDGVYDLIRIEDERYVFSAGPDREVQLTRELGLAKVVRGHQRLEFTPPAQPPWPLEVGKVEQAASAVTGSAVEYSGRG